MENRQSHAIRQGANVGEVIFRCKKTGLEFDSGFQASPSEVQLLPVDAKTRLRCRICGDLHEFKFTDAQINENTQFARVKEK